MDSGSLTVLVEAALGRSWGRDSSWHGEEHWRCVAATGLALAENLPSADRELVLCFGLLHDTRRENEWSDPEHGLRAERFANELRDEGLLALGDRRFALLATALRLHADGHVADDETTGACWDADRLHLPRVGIDPDPARLSTKVARGPVPLAAAAALRSAGAPGWTAHVTRVCSTTSAP